MVRIGEEMIVVKIATPNAGEIFNKVQHGIIDTVQAIIGAKADGDTVSLDAKTAKSPCVKLETLRASLLEVETVQTSIAVARRFMPSLTCETSQK